MNELVSIDHNTNAVQVYTAKELRSHVQRVQEAMKGIMKEGVHFGTIPGTPKPSLWKPGAEVLCMMFHIAPSFDIDDLSSDDLIRYRVTCTGTHQATRMILGEGLGECSTGEEKYKWRRAVCPDEYEDIDPDRRRKKWAMDKSKNEAYFTYQVRTEPADLANTVLKMAVKRAQVAMTINVLAASDIFSQDLEPEDLPPDGQRRTASRGGKPQTAAPQSRAQPSSGGRMATDAQLSLMKAKAKDAGMDAEDVCKKFGINDLMMMPFDQVNNALSFIADPELYVRKEAGNGT
jgi:hypothetical protein